MKKQFSIGDFLLSLAGRVFALTTVRCAAFSFVINAVLLAGSAFADVQQEVARIFELNAKIRPGMTIEAVNELLGPPAEQYVMKDKAVTRYMWLHGEMGVEIYEMDDSAYRVNITLPCGSAKETSRAMDALTRQGNSKYGAMPRFDSRAGQYYWIKDGVRFSFSKYDQTTVLSSCTKMR
ncbi:MAG: hypothetical protein LBP21_08690 [Synergistaceae bacterium]|nr:hypothetical protein [Synergistaceae bacterium]